MPVVDEEALTGAFERGGSPHLLSWVFGEPLNHVLQFPETYGVGAESFPGPWFARTVKGAEGRPGEPGRVGGVRRRPDRPGHVLQNFQEGPRLPPGMHVSEHERAGRRAGRWGTASGGRTFTPQGGSEGVAQILTW